MKSRIHNLEEKLKSSPYITPEEKATLENALAQATTDKELAIQERDEALRNKEEAIRVHELTRVDLNKETEQVVALTAERDELSNKVLLLEKYFTFARESCLAKDAETARLANVIQVIEGEKTDNFEIGLVLARWYTEHFPGWEQIN